MKNVTITLDEELLRWARIRAAEQESSVSAVVSNLLRREMAAQGDFEREWQDFVARTPKHPISDGTPYPTREEIYDRPVLRRFERPDLHEGQPGFAEAHDGDELAQSPPPAKGRRAKPSKPG